MFEDRRDAGEKLAAHLEKYRDRKALVLAIPRGGAEVGYRIAKHLNADFSIIIARKLQFPDNPEAGFGAVAEDGSAFIMKEARLWFSPAMIESIKKRQKEEVIRRIEALRKGRPLPEISGKIVILVDDGIAMGSTMRASIMLCRNKKAAKVAVASPVSGRDVAREMEKLADEVVILEKPPFFRAVAEVYKNWYDVPDSEVIAIMKEWEGSRKR